MKTTINNGLLYFSIIVFCIAFALLFKLRDAKDIYVKTKKTLDSLEWKYDSVGDALFSTEVELGRYQITLENMDTITKKKFEDFLYSQTE